MEFQDFMKHFDAVDVCDREIGVGELTIDFHEGALLPRSFLTPPVGLAFESLVVPPAAFPTRTNPPSDRGWIGPAMGCLLGCGYYWLCCHGPYALCCPHRSSSKTVKVRHSLYDYTDIECGVYL